MNREIKFRAWSLDKMWSWDQLITKKNIQTVIQRKLSWIPMQFTGLKDKNGKEIYEGDILDNGVEGVVWLVVYADMAAQFRLNKYIDGEYENHKTSLSMYIREMDYFEVIGNIYENLELIK